MLRRSELVSLSLVLVLAACAAKETERAVEPVAPLDSGQDGALPDTDEDGDEAADSDAGDSHDLDECASLTEGTTKKIPVDIVFIVDNSGSMVEEIRAIRERINSDFAEIIADSGVDYRVIMLTAYGDEPPRGNAYTARICIDPPLSGRACDEVDEPFVTNGPRFFHYNALIDSVAGWCRLLDSLEQPDEWLFYDAALKDPQPAAALRPDWQTKFPHGIQEILRKEAFKSIVLVSDDSTNCETKRAYDAVGVTWQGDIDAHEERFRDGAYTSPGGPERDERIAAQFDRVLTGRAPDQFGTPEKRNYRFHAVVGLDAEGAVRPDAPLLEAKCSTADTAGVSHQVLSRLTGGLRFSVCRHDNYDALFHALARDAIASAQLPCRFEIPPPPAGETFAPNRVNVEYTREGEPARVFPRAADAAHCADHDAWFYDDNETPHEIVMCPKSCSALSAAESGSVHIALGCETILL